MGRCYLTGHGPCAGQSREHILPKVILDALARQGKAVRVVGWPGIPAGEGRIIGISSLTSGILCEGHNNGMSDLDGVLGRFWAYCDAAHERSDALPDDEHLSGVLLERAFFKVMAGVVAANGFTLPHNWGYALTGEREWPRGTGLHVVVHGEHRLHTREVTLRTEGRAPGHDVFALTVHFGGPVLRIAIEPGEHGERRPRRLVFQHPDRAKTLHLDWPANDAAKTVTYTRREDGPEPERG